MRTFRRTLALGLVGAAGLLLAAAQAPAADSGRFSGGPYSHRPARHFTLGIKVLNYAKGELHQKVGAGQCWDLVDSALRAAGADASGDASYVFGRPVGLDAVQPGDCIQLENVSFKHTNPDGSWYTNDFPHHSAIVAKVEGQTLTVLNQNVNGDMTVQYGTISLADRLPGGTIQAYRPK